jgi:hypothetical protein
MADEVLSHPESKRVFLQAVTDMVEDDMKNLDLKMFDVFYIWTMGRNRFMKEQSAKEGKPNVTDS